MTPVEALRALGIAPPIWAREAPEIGFTRAGRKEWRYRAKFLATSAIVPVAHLIVEGWDVVLDRDPAGLIIRISKKENA
ncbi:hypothetical protein ACFUTX_06770 [Microbacterium sp. NPDC057407]|uniref:hypothetical protein n=1 Tax=Microbacterium sp. NPDC057407 TaxID=3346120 RepID=UPI00366CEF76